MPLVSIIIINWNGGELLHRCLDAVFAQTFKEFEVIIVDNASTDNSIESINKLLPSISIIHMESNVGFAAANNVAARVAKGKWLALLNCDAFPEASWLEELIEASTSHTGPYFFTSCQIQAHHPDRLDGTGDMYSVGGLAWRRQYDHPVEDVLQTNDEVFSACGAAAFYPKSAFLEAGGFDESFFSYLEDVDLGFRLRLIGYRCLFVPQARVFHVGSASLGKKSDFAIYYGIRNMIWVFFKNMPGKYFWKYLPYHIITGLGYAAYYSLCCCPCVSFRATRDALMGLPSILNSRKKIQANLHVHPEDIISLIRDPLRGNSNPISFLMHIPTLFVKLFVMVKLCREQRFAR